MFTSNLTQDPALHIATENIICLGQNNWGQKLKLMISNFLCTQRDHVSRPGEAEAAQNELVKYHIVVIYRLILSENLLIAWE